MKLLTKLEHSKVFWYLLGITFLFFILRLPSLIEPNWYGDEGIYQVIGMALHKGELLYNQIWDNKPPLLYAVYALFNGEQQSVRLISLLVGSFSIIAFFYLSQKLFQRLKTSIITTTIFAILFGTPYIEGNIANAENFILLPIIMAAILIYSVSQREKYLLRNTKYLILFSTGLLVGIAFLFKTVAIFDLSAFFLFLCIITVSKKFLWKTLIHNALFFILGFLFPITITIIYFTSQNTLNDFLQAAFSGNIDYVGWKNDFFIPQGFLIFKLLLLIGVIILIFLKRRDFSSTSLFIIIWLVFSLFSAFFSQRPYTHYVLMALPSVCLTVGLFFSIKTKKEKMLLGLFLILTLFLILNNFRFYGLDKTALYYQNALLFIMDKKNVTEYQNFFDDKTPRDYEVASFIKTHTTQKDRIFLWGDSAQIYALSNTLPINKYTVAYHIINHEQALQETQAAINTVKPKYIITLSEAPSLPFQMSSYTLKFILIKATIYERNF